MRTDSDLLGDLALHRLDVVLSDAAQNPNIKLYSPRSATHPSPGTPRFGQGCDLTVSPALLTCQVRSADRPWQLCRAGWTTGLNNGITRIVGEFEDNPAQTFGACGMDMFHRVVAETCWHYLAAKKWV
jgi:hypothetical protein